MANIEGAISSLDKDIAELKAKSKITVHSGNKLELSVDFNATDITDLKRDLLDLKFENENLKTAPVLRILQQKRKREVYLFIYFFLITFINHIVLNYINKCERLCYKHAHTKPEVYWYR